MQNQLSHPLHELMGTTKPPISAPPQYRTTMEGSPTQRPPAGRLCQTAAPSTMACPPWPAAQATHPVCSHLTAGFSTPGEDEAGLVQAGGRDGEGARNCPGVSQADNGSSPASARRSPARLACAGAAALRSNMAAAPPPASARASRRRHRALPGRPEHPGGACAPPASPLAAPQRRQETPCPFRASPRLLAELRPRHLASGRGAARHAPRAELAASSGPGGGDRRENREYGRGPGEAVGLAVPASPAPAEAPRPPPLLPSRQAEPPASRRLAGAGGAGPRRAVCPPPPRPTLSHAQEEPLRPPR